jgi:acetoin utilization deacetylase AcuC-like enzyme
MTTAFLTHEICAGHEMGPGHPERPERLHAVWEALGAAEFDDLQRHDAPLAGREQIERVHPAAYVEAIEEAAPSEGYARLDPDTLMSPASFEAAMRAAGAVTAATDLVMAGSADNAFCAVRPPGHHAEPARSMGFCIFNNVAIGALHARAEHGLQKIAVVDFDVHHGNGTQAAFWEDADLFFASSHQSPFYPGSGRESETGAGNIHNAELAAGSGSAQFRAAWQGRLLPALDAFAPEFLFISAGFDGHTADPLAELNLSTADFAWLSGELLGIAQKHCAGRVVSTLEGGYDLTALAEASAAHVRSLLSAGGNV